MLGNHNQKTEDLELEKTEKDHTPIQNVGQFELLQSSTYSDNNNKKNHYISEKDMSSSRIWTDIAVTSRTKEIREVIEIVEDRSHFQDQEKGEKVTSQKPLTKVTYQILQQNEKDKPSITSLPANHHHHFFKPLHPKQDYWNKQSFHTNELYLKQLNYYQHNDAIHQSKMNQLIVNNDHNHLPLDQERFIKIQLQAIDALMRLCRNDNSKDQGQEQHNSFNIIRVIDVLYKKYILRSGKFQVTQLKQQRNQLDNDEIYQPNLIQGQRYYRLKDQSFDENTSLLSNKFQQTNQFNFKRGRQQMILSSNENNCVSLIDNESTNQNGDYLENIAVNYVNGIRRQRLGNSQTHQETSSNSIMSMSRPHQQQATIIQNTLPTTTTNTTFPFDIQIPQHTASRQFNPGYNLLQGPDDQKNERFQQQRTIAKTFVRDGYGLQIVRNYIQNMDGGTYNRAITTIIRQSYKKIQDFLIKQCNIQIHSLTSSQFSLVKTPLVHCRNILSEQDKNTFFKYIAITYKFGKLREDILPTAAETYNLYKAIFRGMQDRKSVKEMNSKPGKDNYYRGG